MPAALIAQILQYAIEYGIPAAREIVALVHKTNPTLEDWNKAFDVAESNAIKFLDATK